MCRLLAVVLITLASLAVQAEVYQWRDDSGRLHYGNRQLPAAASVLPQTTGNSFAGGINDLLPGRRQVVLYATEWCGYCKKAREYFRANRIDFIEYDIEKDAEALRRYRAFGGRAVPVIFVGGQRLDGFSAERFAALWQEQSGR